ncbi:unnamed protein product [Clonostachys rosea]|uniref:Prion-inhibition and propagation HeLo domain-containing protein n=1 Tax=Bionectria ochroleuca TaxID=29856 RepID=A0ABY6TSN8_BIOOC|nr:unnamed protein product [Clonostachys rosea]
MLAGVILLGGEKAHRTIALYVIHWGISVASSVAKLTLPTMVKKIRALLKWTNYKEAMRRAGLKHQSTAAEIKSTASYTALSKCMAQLWFGRTSWLIRGVHSNGTFRKVSVTNAGADFYEWEEENQTRLQKLVAMLKELRAITRASGGGQCAAIFEKMSNSHEIRVFRTTDERQALPEPLIARFWGS